jgi:thioredoxin 1
MAPIVEELAQEYEGKAVIGKYNIEEENDLAMKYRIMSIPTILFFKNGEQVASLRMAGAQQKDALKARIDELLAL